MHIVYRSIAGSTLYGMNTPESDLDKMGFLVEPRTHIIGLHKFEQTVEDECTIYSLRKYVSLLAKGNPTVSEILFAPKHLVEIDEFNIRMGLLWDSEAWLTQRTLKSYLGYMGQQWERLIGLRGQRNVNRHELIEKHGYDTKYAAHIIRLGLLGNELAQTGGLVLPMPSAPRSLLKSIRAGKFSLEVIKDLKLDLEADLERQIKLNRFPAESDRNKLSDLLVTFYNTVWEATNDTN